MRLVKINYRNEKLDTEGCYCINNYLWNKDKVQIISKTEMLVPKYYTPRHVGQLKNRKLADARYRARNPLKRIKGNYEAHQEDVRKSRKRGKRTDKHYRFSVDVTAAEYKMLWNFLYKEVRSPLDKGTRIQTIEEMIEKRERKDK